MHAGTCLISGLETWFVNNLPTFTLNGIVSYLEGDIGHYNMIQIGRAVSLTKGGGSGMRPEVIEANNQRWMNMGAAMRVR